MYTIGEVARRSGFTASALRYYEGIGLVSPTMRTQAGYRVYDDRVLARLGFIARAKHVGCTLKEIVDLVELWDGEQCGPAQRRFHDLVTTKIADAERQVLELTALTAQLRTAAARLTRPAIDGPCGDGCACVAEAPATSPVPVVLLSEPDDPPIACTLDAEALPDRLTEWRALLERARSRATTDDGALRIDFGGELSVAALAHLVAAEQHCCAFFSFSISVDPRGVALEVRAPDGAEDVVASLFGRPT